MSCNFPPSPLGEIPDEKKPLEYYIERPGLPNGLIKQLKFWADTIPGIEVCELSWGTGTSMRSLISYTCVLIAKSSEGVKITIKLEGDG